MRSIQSFSKPPRALTPPETQQLATLPTPLPHIVHQSLCHALVLRPAVGRPAAMAESGRVMLARGIFRAHARQDVLTRTQTDKQRKGDQPNTQPEVGSHLRERRHILVVNLVRLAPVTLVASGRRQWPREMAEP